MTVAWPASVAVIGGGTMGGGIAHLLARQGVRCTVADQDQASADRSRDRAVAMAEEYVAAGFLPAGAPDTVAEHLTAVASTATAVEGADLIIEAVTENLAVKRPIFAAIEDACPTDAVVTSNTSAIPIAAMAAELRRPERFLGMHWFNPPQLVPGVELIPCPVTDASVVELVKDALLALGKRPAVVGDSAGFVGNRIQFAMFREAAAVVRDGVATAEAVDEVVRNTFGFRLPLFGPFAIADMAGLDVYAGAYDSLEAAFGPRFSTPEAVQELIEGGRLGVKSGGGFVYGDDTDVDAVLRRRDRGLVGMADLMATLDQAPAPAD